MTSRRRKSHAILQTMVLAAVAIPCVEAGAQSSCTGGATATYQFTGTCSTGNGNCTGTGVGQLTVQHYTLGNNFASCNFVSFTYHSNILNLTINSGNFGSLSGRLPPSLPSTANVTLYDSTFTYGIYSQIGGSWNTNPPQEDFGSSHIWGVYVPPSGVPTLGLPSLIALGALLALLGTILLRRLPRQGAACPRARTERIRGIYWLGPGPRGTASG